MFFHVLLLFLLHGFGGELRGASSLGINYGQIGDDLPSPDKVLDMLMALKITKVRIYDTNQQILSAFANSNVEIIVTVENEMLGELTNPQQALQWVATRIKPYVPATRVTGIAIGNEVFTDDDLTLMETLVPAMLSIHIALSQLGLDTIKVSTPSSLAVLQESYPPSAGSFKPEITGIMSQFLQFLNTTKAPFWINAYPYFAYKDNSNNIPLEYVIFNPNPGMIDPYTNLHYDNMLYAQADAVLFAMAKLGFGGIEVRVSETGWPSKGDPNEVGASLENAANYNRNLLRRQMANEGTPLRPNLRLEVYLFALFNENMKPGPTSERNYGLYQPDGTMAYNVGLSSFKGTSFSPSSSSISLTSMATREMKGSTIGYCRSLVYSMFVYLITSRVFTRRLF
ncbi:glucan endo-1,3-beta-glucosidase 14-like [Cucurbita moschata]|uniref:glucan endo-1,3-beta-D-glucosidase n=1 Tax=Cucurbita moschata TaxID=3662 RepID=A0A6J1GSZ9_CUCMO|nr:glucan endo-1,3-beta-glucosidase 14-like [Cucurbita moschata]